MEVVASVCLAIGRKGRLAFSSDSMVKMVQSIFFLVTIIFIPGEEGEVEEEKDEETPLPGQVDQAGEGEADDAGGAEDQQALDADDLDM